MRNPRFPSTGRAVNGAPTSWPRPRLKRYTLRGRRGLLARCSRTRERHVRSKPYTVAPHAAARSAKNPVLTPPSMTDRDGGVDAVFAFFA